MAGRFLWFLLRIFHDATFAFELPEFAVGVGVIAGGVGEALQALLIGLVTGNDPCRNGKAQRKEQIFFVSGKDRQA